MKTIKDVRWKIISWLENVWLKEKENGREIERKWEGTW